jgi:hypothetical protein
MGQGGIFSDNFSPRVVFGHEKGAGFDPPLFFTYSTSTV